MMAARRCSDPNLFYVALLSFFYPVLKLLFKKCRYWHRVAEGHKSRREAPSRGASSPGWGSGGITPWNFFL